MHQLDRLPSMVSVDHLAFITTQASSPLASATTSRAAFAASGSTNIAAAAFVTKTKMASYEHDSLIVSASSPAAAAESFHDVDVAKDLNHDEKFATTTRQPIHFCFIVHGHNGRPTDLSYLHNTVKAKAKYLGLFIDAKSSESCAVGKMTGDGGTKVITAGISEDDVHRRSKRDRLPFMLKKKKHEKSTLGATSNTDQDMILNPVDSNADKSKGTLIVHNAACNKDNTHDGIIKGGERLANEMIEVIRTEVKKQHDKYTNVLNQNDDSEREQQTVDITISIVGNSLGGLYGRSAIAHLDEVLDSSSVQTLDECGKHAEEEAYQYYLLDGHMRIHLNVFCSISSPHLGCASHTFFPIPRTAETGIARVLDTTGLDLFRVNNNVVHDMATSPRFLDPLASFRKRIAYANLAWDFPVPGSTAAFLDGNSDSPHYFEEQITGAVENVVDSVSNGIELSDCPASKRGLTVATLHTPRFPIDSAAKDSKAKTGSLAAMASSLDSLGWKKIFVDIRSELPMAVQLPTLFYSDCPMSRLKSNNNPVVTSRDLEKAVSNSNWSRLGPPLGHNAICAFSRGTVSTVVNSGGRPVMDSLAMNLTNDISSWNGPN